jgi:2-dehydro-3-deoxy-L-rhamnonate dehydrogenase (NAD+)
MRAQSGVDLEDHLVGHARQLSCPLEVGRKLCAPGREGHLCLKLECLGRSPHLRGVQPAGAKRVERELFEPEPAGRTDQIGPLGPERVVRDRIERHRAKLSPSPALRSGGRDIRLRVNAYDFGGRVALVTGGASGIGAATVELLRTSGARVAVLDVDPNGLHEDVLPIRGDVTRSEDAEAAVARADSELGGLDILVCSAGVGGDSVRAVDMPDEEWRRVFAINCDGTFFCNRAAVRRMILHGYGRVVNVASIAGKEGNPNASAYSASKAAVIGMTKSIGKEVAGSGVLVNCIAPAVIDTPILGQLSEEHIGYMLQKIPLGRIGKPEEVAHLIAYLASENLSFATGACFDISGGRAVY